jgi:type VI secretion system protein ImpA
MAPIAGENPTGRDLRTDFSPKSAYREIRDARRKAAEAERSLLLRGGVDDQGQPVAPPDWRPVLQLAPKVLAEQSKDLEIAALWIEALVRKHGFAGLRDGFRLVRELVEQFWDHLYPLPDEDGVRTRVYPLVALNGEESDGVLVGPILRVPITSARATGEFSVFDYRQALELDSLQDPDARARRLEQPGVVTLQAFQKSVAETSPAVFKNLLEDLDQCREEFRRLSEVLEEKCGQDESGHSSAPPTSNVRGALDSVREDFLRIAGPVLGLGAEGETSGGEGGESGAGPGDELGSASARIRSREEAFRTLLRVAEFFKRTEPHSPIAYALEQAVRWGRMSLPQLLQELIPEEATRQQLFKLVGIVPDRGSQEGAG